MNNLDKNLNLLALMPCPLKVPIEQEFTNFINQLEANNITYLIDSNANNQLSFYDKVDDFTSIDDIPDIIISSGINNFFRKPFVDRFIDKGLFVDVSSDKISELLKKSGIKDPDGNYTIISMNILVMVVDLTQIGDLPIPKKWSDLLNEEYENKVIIRGQNDFFCETTLLTIYKSCGLEGIKKLGKSVKEGWHPAQMARVAGTGLPDSPAISVMPYFYTKTIQSKDHVLVVWPEDGAIVSPVSMLVKKSKLDKLKKVAEFFTGEKVAQISSGAYFPSLYPTQDENLPENATFNWIGWDFIKSNDVGAIIENLNKHFLNSLRGDI